MKTVRSLVGLVVTLSCLAACDGSGASDTGGDGDSGGDGQGGEGAGEDGSGAAPAGTGGFADDDNHEICDAPSDTLTTDELTLGRASVICYYAPSEGYCRELASATSVEYAEAGDKGAFGCADAVVVTGGSCPLDTAVGRCKNWGADESRVYYECNKFDAIYPDGLEKGCSDAGGTWEAF